MKRVLVLCAVLAVMALGLTLGAPATEAKGRSEGKVRGHKIGDAKNPQTLMDLWVITCNNPNLPQQLCSGDTEQCLAQCEAYCGGTCVVVP